jgi:hypothetical protein
LDLKSYLTNVLQIISRISNEFGVEPQTIFTLTPPSSTTHSASEDSKKQKPELPEIYPEVDDTLVQSGQKFQTLDDAAKAFQTYSRKCGFTGCRGNSKKDVY